MYFNFVFFLLLYFSVLSVLSFPFVSKNDIAVYQSTGVQYTLPAESNEFCLCVCVACNV